MKTLAAWYEARTCARNRPPSGEHPVFVNHPGTISHDKALRLGLKRGVIMLGVSDQSLKATQTLGVKFHRLVPERQTVPEIACQWARKTRTNPRSDFLLSSP